VENFRFCRPPHYGPPQVQKPAGHNVVAYAEHEDARRLLGVRRTARGIESRSGRSRGRHLHNAARRTQSGISGAGSGWNLEGCKRAVLIVDMISINPPVSQKIAKERAAKGADLFDAPVSGGGPKAVVMPGESLPSRRGTRASRTVCWSLPSNRSQSSDTSSCAPQPLALMERGTRPMASVRAKGRLTAARGSAMIQLSMIICCSATASSGDGLRRC